MRIPIFRSLAKVVGIGFLAIALLGGAAVAAVALGGTDSASAAGAPLAVDECNSVFNDGGRGMNCDVTVVNYLNLASNTQHSVTTTVACDGAANTVPLPRCITTVAPSTELVTTVTQCNSALNGGGASLICHVDVTNQLYDPLNTSTTTAATVNQCVGSGIPGTAPTTVCNPAGASTTNATVTQCNGSGNGGTASMIVLCDVDPASMITSALPVTVNQCNGSSNGGGATVVCATALHAQLLTLAEATTIESTALPTASQTTNGVSNYAAPTPPAPPAVVTPVTPTAAQATATAATLAATGVDLGASPLIASIALLLGTILTLAAVRRRALNPTVEHK